MFCRSANGQSLTAGPWVVLALVVAVIPHCKKPRSQKRSEPAPKNTETISAVTSPPVAPEMVERKFVDGTLKVPRDVHPSPISELQEGIRVPFDASSINVKPPYLWVQITQCPPVLSLSDHGLKDLWVGKGGDLVLVGTSGRILMRRNGVWTCYQDPEMTDFVGVDGTTIDDVCVIGGTSIHAFDGKNWHLTETNGENLADVWVSGEGGIWAIERFGVVVEVTEESITYHQPEPTARLEGIIGKSPDEVYIAGSVGYLQRHDGKTWSAMEPPTSDDIVDLALGGDGSLGIVTDVGEFLWFEDGTWEDVDTGSMLARRVVPDSEGTLLFLGAVWQGSWLDDRGIYRVTGKGPVKVHDPLLEDIIDVQIQDDEAYILTTQEIGTGRGEMDLGSSMLHDGPLWGSGPSSIWSVGRNGTIGHFDGKSWRKVQSTTDADLYELHGVDEKAIWAAGMNVILRYDGDAWSRLELPGVSHVQEIHVLSYDHAFLLTSTSDVFEYSEGNIRHHDLPTASRLWGIWGRDADHVWAVGDHGAILFWDGESWKPEAAATGLSLIDISGMPGGEAVASGEVLLKRTDAGWTLAGPGGDRGLYVLDHKNVFLWRSFGIGGEYAGLHHWDGELLCETGEVLYGGKYLDDGQADIPGNTVYSVWGTSDGAIWGVGDGLFALQKTGETIGCDDVEWRENSISFEPECMEPVSSDSPGRDWSAALLTRFNLNGVWADGFKDVFAVGDGGTVLRFDGSKVESVNSGTLHGLADVWGSSPDRVWAAGDHGTLQRYDGHSWKPVETPTTSHFTVITGAADSQLWIGTSSGELLSFDGERWKTIRLSPPEPIRSVLVQGNGRLIVGTDTRLIRISKGKQSLIDSDVYGGSFILGPAGSRCIVNHIDTIANLHDNALDLLGDEDDLIDIYITAVHGSSMSNIWFSGEDGEGCQVEVLGGTLGQWNGKRWDVYFCSELETINDVVTFASGEVVAVGDGGLFLWSQSQVDPSPEKQK